MYITSLYVEFIEETFYICLISWLVRPIDWGGDVHKVEGYRLGSLFWECPSQGGFTLQFAR
jgi:hypothetical protein